MSNGLYKRIGMNQNDRVSIIVFMYVLQCSVAWRRRQAQWRTAVIDIGAAPGPFPKKTNFAAGRRCMK